MTAMPCGNTAALRAHEAHLDRLDRDAPTTTELERYVEDWMERKAKALGIEFVAEPLAEADDVQRIPLFAAYQSGKAIAIGEAVQKIVADYWRPSAERDAEAHDFASDRVPCRCRGTCYC